MDKPKILLVDDETNFREGLAIGLLDAGFECIEASNGSEALEKFDTLHPDAAVTDLMMPGMKGDELVRRLLEKDELFPVIVLTAHGSTRDAVSSIRDGAKNFVTKPVNIDQLVGMLRTILKENQLTKKTDILSQKVSELENKVAQYTFGTSRGTQTLVSTIAKVAPSNLNILLEGESGSGKQVVAELIHSLSNVSCGPFVDAHCASFSPTLLEDELFGHHKGAFTGAVNSKTGIFERADGGTLFLDEIGEISPELQVKLLKVIEEKSFSPLGSNETLHSSFRLICATNRNLFGMVKEGTFREDLYYRLASFSLFVPPLRQRSEDILPLANAFLKKFSAEMKKEISSFSIAAANVLKKYSWPGNIRELKSAIEVAVVMASGSQIEVSDLPESIIRNFDVLAEGTKEELSPFDLSRPIDPAQINVGNDAVSTTRQNDEKIDRGSITITLDKMEKMQAQIAFQVYKSCSEDAQKAAEILGISTKTLRKYLLIAKE